MWNDPRVRAIVSQTILVIVLIWAGWSIVDNTIHNLEQRKIASGFGFLGTTAGFGINQTLVDYNEASSYGTAFIVGLLNTLLLAFIGCILATFLGFLMGVMRLSRNWLIAKIATVYVEVMRNIPLLLQILVWYALLLETVPDKRGAFTLIPGLMDINKTGIWMPQPIPEPGFWMTALAFLIGIAAAVYTAKWAKKRQEDTGEQFPVMAATAGWVIGFPAIVFLITGMPLMIEWPVFVETGPMLRRGYQQGEGMVLNPEFVAMLIALVTYTAGFIAEIVRAGIQAVSHGQTEAAGALGLRRGAILRLVVIPQALRVIIPPLTSQYLNLTKNSSLAVAIAYMDLVAVGGIILNQTGQAIEIIGLWMLIYLTISLLTSAFMNWYNAKMALVER